MLPPRREGVADVFQRLFGGGEPCGIPRHDRAQALRITRREHEQTRLRQPVGGIRILSRGALQNRMRVGSAEPERVDCRDRILAGQVFGRDRHAEHPLLEIDVRVRRFEMQVGGDFAVVENQRGLDDSGNAGACLEVADIGFDRADDAGPPGAVFADDRPDRGGLDRIADRGPRAMRLDVIDFQRIDPRVAAGLADQAFLRLATRHREAARPSVLVHRATADHRVNPVASRDGCGERFQHDHARAFAAHKPVSARVERLAAAVGREHRHFAEADIRVRDQDRVDPPGQRRGALAIFEAPAREMHRHQRGRASRVHGKARAAKIEQVGDAVGRDAEHAAGRAVGVDRGFVAEARLDLRVVVRRNSDEHAGFGTRRRIRNEPCVLDGFPRRLEQEPLLRVHESGLPRRNPEKGGIELVDPVDEPAPSRVRFSGKARLGIVIGGDVPAVRRDFRDRVDAVAEHVPKGLGPAGSSGKTAADSGDRDLFVLFHRVVFTCSHRRLHQF